jgi:hypothetical protein
VDLFVNTFEVLAIYFAVAILESREQRLETSEQRTETGEQEIETGALPETTGESQLASSSTQSPTLKSLTPNLKSLISNHLFLYSIGFGFAFGMALASKVNIYPLAILLPGAFALRYFITDRKAIESHLPEGEAAVSNQSRINNYWLLITTCLIAGGLAAFISFRIFQPYAFNGLLPDERWTANIKEQRLQANGDSDQPWNLQWARRSHLYSFENLTIWGLGLPLGILAWAGFLYMGWRIIKGEWRHALLWGWTAIYFLWQSLQFNPTMRYQLPIYPLLVMMAAWFVFELARLDVQPFKRLNLKGCPATLCRTRRRMKPCPEARPG